MKQRKSPAKSREFSKTGHCVKTVLIRSYSGPHFPAIGLNTEIYGVSLRIQSECGKIRTRITPNPNTFYTVGNRRPSPVVNKHPENQTVFNNTTNNS